MKIELITKQQYSVIMEIQKSNKKLTFENVGYDYVDKSKFEESDKEAFDKITAILKEHITGFSEFNNFCTTKNGEISIRMQYNYGAEDNSMYFNGVGYILVKELLNGFNN